MNDGRSSALQVVERAKLWHGHERWCLAMSILAFFHLCLVHVAVQDGSSATPIADSVEITIDPFVPFTLSISTTAAPTGEKAAVGGIQKV